MDEERPSAEHTARRGVFSYRWAVLVAIVLALIAFAAWWGLIREEARVAAEGSTVSVHYRGTLDNGEEFDSSQGREPLTFEVGSGQVIPGFEQAVVDMSEGESKTFRVEPDEAYGQRRDDLVISVPTNQAPDGLEVGQQVRLGDAPATVVDVNEDEVTVDANHPLAGEALNFDIELVSVQ